MADKEIFSLSFAFANRHGVMIDRIDADAAYCFCRQTPPPPQILSELRAAIKKPIKINLLDNETFNSKLGQYHDRHDDIADQLSKDFTGDINLKDLLQELPKSKDLLEMQDDAPIIRLLNALLSQAIKEEASDIHIESFDNKLIVRFRIDGVLQEVANLPGPLASLLVSRVKVMAKLDIAEKRLPQDGRIAIKLAGRAVDIRVSTLPSTFGERVVLRILDQQAARLNLTDLGMSGEILEKIKKIISQPHGIFLVTGPTGAGKSTTLYAALSILNNSELNILTIEDPVEYNIPGIGQTQVNNKVEMTFARGLRAILRQDPDVVMVGEIRDKETADIAVQASLTGHLVLSTLHTNTAIGAITRLHDMHVQPFLLSSSLLGVAAQRLVRLLCPQCKKAKAAIETECEFLGVKQATIYEAVGCQHCRKTGYAGRTGIYEIIIIDETLRKLINQSADEQTLIEYVRIRVPSIQADGIRRVLLGETSIEEVLRVTRMEE
jgi:general secretion pathway protein E